MASIDQFKAQLIGGLFKQIDLKFSFLEVETKLNSCAKHNIPAGTLGEVIVPFRGHNLKLAGERTFEDWQITIINDVEFSARSGLEAWQEDIQALDSGEGSTSTDYLIDRAFVEQLNKDDSVFARYEFFNMFPKQ